MIRFRYLLLFLPALLLTTPVVIAADFSIKTMAGIVMNMHHYPSADEKKTLHAIAENDHSTVGEKQLATALINIQHSVDSSDAERLRALTKDMKASQQERELAEILLGFNHMASSSQKEQLQKLLGAK